MRVMQEDARTQATWTREPPQLPPVAKKHISKKITKWTTIFHGNKAYEQYYWEDGLIGPMPDYGKGFA